MQTRERDLSIAFRNSDAASIATDTLTDLKSMLSASQVIPTSRPLASSLAILSSRYNSA